MLKNTKKVTVATIHIKKIKKVFGEFLCRASIYRPRPINSGISRRILISLHGIANFELVREVVRMCAHTSSTM